MENPVYIQDKNVNVWFLDGMGLFRKVLWILMEYTFTFQNRFILGVCKGL